MRIVRDSRDGRYEGYQGRLMGRACLLAVLMAATHVAHAGDDASWEARCGAASPLDKIVAHSASGDALEDDMTLTLAWRDGARTALPWPTAWYHKAEALSAGGDACPGLGVVPAGAHALVVVVAVDGRPGFDHLRIALVDTRTHAVLDTIADFGEVPNDYSHRYARGRLAFQAWREWHDDVPTAGWKDVLVSGRRLRAAWRP